MNEFIKELGQLPPDRQKAIKEGLQKQIIAQAVFVRDEQPTKFLDYVDEEIEKANASMLKMIQDSSREGAELGAISEIYIWNKERKKALVRLRDEVQTEPEQTAPEPQQHTILELFPKDLLNDRAKTILLNAVNDGAIIVAGEKLKFQGSNALLAYMLGIAFCGDTKQYDTYLQGYKVKRGSAFFQDKLLSGLFGVKNLGQSRLQLDSVPKGYERVEKWLV